MLLLEKGKQSIKSMKEKRKLNKERKTPAREFLGSNLLLCVGKKFLVLKWERKPLGC